MERFGLQPAVGSFGSSIQDMSARATFDPLRYFVCRFVPVDAGALRRFRAAEIRAVQKSDVLSR